MAGKTPRQLTGAAGRWATIGLCAAVFAGPGMAQKEAKAPEPLETELIRIRKMITNASAKLKNDIVGIGSHEAAAPATPAGQCCANNLQRIEQRVRVARRILEDFDRCYAEEGNQDMVMSVRVAKSDLVAFTKTASFFADAPTKGRARAGLNAMTLTYNLLRETAVSLEPCEGVESKIDPDEESRTSEDGGQPKRPREN